jgi:hypothetical protein
MHGGFYRLSEYGSQICVEEVCMKKLQLRRGWCLLPALAAIGLASAALAETSNKWRIEFNEKAQQDGAMVFAVTPVGAAPTRIVANIPGGLSENNIAEVVSKSFKAGLDANYQIEVDDGEHVLIKKQGDAPDFEVKLISSSVTGVEVDLQRE